MIIVAGTKRSGTSMWMQVLKAAGLPVLGRAFPGGWSETLRDANPEGFYESSLRFGIYYATNPNPKTGRFLAPDETRHHAIKVFAPGLVKTDLAYVHRVIASVRSFREYVPSLARLYAIERANRRAQSRRSGMPDDPVDDVAPLPSILEWWAENYGLIRDAAVRRYPLRLLSYASVLRAPEQVIPEVLAWVGQGDPALAVRAVRAELRTHHPTAPSDGPSGVSAAHEALFDALFARIDQGEPIDDAFTRKLEQANEALAPALARARSRHRRARKRALARAQPATPLAADD